MEMQTMCSSMICFPLGIGGMLSGLILFSASFALSIWGMVNAAPVTIIFFLSLTTAWMYYLFGLYKRKLIFMLPAIISGAVSIFGLCIALTIICFSAFLTENDVVPLEHGLFFNISKKEHFVTLFIGTLIQGFLVYFCYIAFCAYEKIRMDQEQLSNIHYQTHDGMDIERQSEINEGNNQSYDL
ncbi:uncharacterized protein LOC129574511 [Sitodiplosis mosellana]|uniref:uncharacterized protein LOC129574511 n=1 Tax=Sitodiplosis mosellana TaxID=263140 RepID=UPI002443F2F5|nr:uncharacterized protein LOC129574511 [Sitodiplosis mosellana]